ncbi:hypothetical protein LEP1GSC036_2553 [Leptospira weilii str. 2006001853]|uniref:Uncharacterized protein n=2 Tax=Leptospira weilii TaxID=28184 RepID=A0A828YY68_9LEPT|nr:hypothetical protein [Leptospira weilii]EKR62845.1 hypothetical protein LEP1GSC036_2553 [Leptospira weilii str. 2006001853]QDK23047.1 hypothetical protein FHG67_10210 [Leptospira weilii]QDK27311.1 hypothetical protein FHG68_12035 [Leptospira weilii]
MINDSINVGIRKEGFWERLNPRKGFSTDIWIGEMVISTSMNDVVFNENIETKRESELEGLKVSFTEWGMQLTFNFERFWQKVKGYPTQRRIADNLNKTLIESGIIVKDWDSFFIERATFNCKFDLCSEDFSFLKKLLHRMAVEDIVKTKNNSVYVLEDYDYDLEFAFGNGEHDSVVHIRFVVTGFSQLALEYDMSYQFDSIDMTDVCSILNNNLAKFFEVVRSMRVDADWFKVLEILTSPQMSNSYDKNREILDTQESLAPDFGRIKIDKIYEDVLGISLHSILKGLNTWMKDTEKVKGELQHALRFLNRNERMIQNLQDKLKISKTLQDYDDFEDYEVGEEF